MNQKLFDSLHDELLKYRDNFLHESLQKPFIHDLVHLFDDLSSLSEQLRTAAEKESGRGHVAQWRDNLENAIHSGVNFPLMIWQWGTGQPIEPVKSYRTGVRTRWLAGDLRWLWESVLEKGR